MKKLLKLTFATLVALAGLVATSCSDDSKGGIHGVAVDAENQEPMRGVNVQLCKQSGTILESTVTYDDGHFEFTDVNPGDYTVIISSTKYPNVKYDFSVQAGRTASFDVPMGLHTNPYMPIYITINFPGDYVGLNMVIPNKKKINIIDEGMYYSTGDNPISSGRKITESLGGLADNYYYKYAFYIAPLNQTTMFNVQGYVKDDKGNTYFSEVIKIVKTPKSPEVKTIDAMIVNPTRVVLEGLIEHKGNPVYSERGFIVSTDYKNPTLSDIGEGTVKVPVDGKELSFKTAIDVVEGSTYHIRAYAVNDVGIAYGEVISFIAQEPEEFYTISNIMIQKEDIGTELTWTAAVTMCSNSREGGYDDWHVSTSTECQLMYSERTRLRLAAACYWEKDDYNSGWSYRYFDMSNGSSHGGNSGGYKYHVRCVRKID